MKTYDVIFGCGGFGKQTAQLLKDADNYWPLLFLSERIEKESVLGIPIHYSYNWHFPIEQCERFVVAFQESINRERVAVRLINAGLTPFNAIHRTVVNYEHNKIGNGNVLCDFVSLHPDSEIGNHVHINSFCYVGHDCVISDYATLTHHIGLAGGVRIGRHAFIGQGSMIRNGVKIGAYSIVGQGSNVLRDVPENVTVVGNPARIIGPGKLGQNTA